MSFGAGVQSTTMLLAAAEGLITPMPDVAIFADTGDEPREVYDHLKLMQSMALPFPIEIVTKGSIREQMLGWAAGRTRNADGRPPLFVRKRNGKVGQTKRQCTQDWKIVPIERRIRELVGVKKGSPGPKTPIVEQWIGISIDEVFRMKPNQKRWIRNRHPLIELDMRRYQCVDFCKARGVNPPKSACRICPYHDELQWDRMAPDDFEAACEVDDALRAGRIAFKGVPYLHRSCRPLREIDFIGAMADQDSFLAECEGHCGV